MTRSTIKDFAPSTCSPENWTQANLKQKLRAMGIERGTSDWQDYERAKHFINGLNLDVHSRDRLVQWAIDFIGV